MSFDLIDIKAKIDIDDLIDTVTFELDEEKSFKMITEIDSSMMNWEFTIKVYNHFKKLYEEFKDQEVEEDAVEEDVFEVTEDGLTLEE